MRRFQHCVSTVLLTVTLLVLALVACGGAPRSTNVNAPTQEITATVRAGTPIISTTARRPLAGEVFSIQGGATLFVDVLAQSDGDTTTPLQLRFDAVKDERCPRLVACVVRGDAVIVIIAQLGQASQPQTLQLHTDPSLDQSHALYAGYDISLTALEPTIDQPGDSLALSAYTATLIVTATADAPPRLVPTARAVPTPLRAFDACVLSDSATVAELVGAVQAPPVSSAVTAHHGQQCVIQTERATVTLQFYLGDTAVIQAIIADAQQAGTRFSELSNSTANMAAFGVDQQHAVLVQQSNDAIFVIEMTFGDQSQPSDRTHARAHLAALHNMMLARYISVSSGQMTLPTAQATP